MSDVHLICMEHNVRKASVGVSSNNALTILLFRTYPARMCLIITVLFPCANI